MEHAFGSSYGMYRTEDLREYLKSCIQKDRGMSIPDCPIGCDFEVGEDYSMGKFAKQYET